MTAWHGLAGNWMVRALGWTLLHFCWQGAVAAAVLWSALQLLGERSAQARYGTACCALALMVALPLGTFARIGVEEYALAAGRHGPTVAVGATTVTAGGAGEASWFAPLALALDPAVPWVLLAWLAGVTLFLFRLSVGFGVTRTLRSLALSPATEELQGVFARLAVRLRVTRPVLLMQSALVQVPTVIGWLRPVVLIPVSCFTGMPQEQIEAVLCHELAHIRRHDYLVSVAQSVVEAVLFYHPAVWWVSRQMRRERECCCDDVAVMVGGNALAYARALTDLEAQRSTYPEVALGANGGILTMRIKRLLMAERSSGAGQMAAVAVLMGLMVGAVAVVNSAQAEGRSAENKSTETRPVVESAMPAASLTAPSMDVPAPAAKTDRPVTKERAARASSTTLATPAVETLCAPTLAGNRRIPTADVLGQISARQGDVFDPAAVERDFNALVNSGDYASVRIERTDRPATSSDPACVQLLVDVQEKALNVTEVAQGQTPMKVAAGVVAGNIISKVNPIYPADAKAAGIQGAVVLKAIISKDGAVANLQVISGPKELMASALDAVRQWTYKPYLLNGQPTEVETTITVNYHMAGVPTAPNGGQASQEIVPRLIGGSVVAPRVLLAPEPQFTDEARAEKVSGAVLLRLWVDADGSPSHVQVVRGIGHGLDEKAVAAVEHYKFAPATEDGKPVTVAINVEVNFRTF